MGARGWRILSRAAYPFAVLAALSPAIPAAASDAPTSGSAARALEQALALVHEDRSDLALPLDYEARDRWRLVLVENAMGDPLSVGDGCQELAHRLAVDSLAAQLREADRALRFVGEPDNPNWLGVQVFRAPGNLPCELAARMREARAAGAADVGPAPLLDLSESLPENSPLLDPLDCLLFSFQLARDGVHDAFSRLDDAQRARLVREGPELVEQDESDPEKDPFQLDAEEKHDLALGDTLLSMATRVDPHEVTGVAMGLSVAVETGMRRLASMSAEELAAAASATAKQSGRKRYDGEVTRTPDGGVRVAEGRASGDVLLYRRVGDFEFVLGGPGRTTYDGAFDLVVDLGGDDVYRAGAGGTGAGKRPVCVALDLAGNDLYQGREPAEVAAGFLGVGVLADGAGDDVYEAGNLALGCGWYGAGILLDVAGNDRYLGDTAVEGAAHVGVGLLSDRGGADTYEGAFVCQGFGFVGGIGILDDRTGNDFYLVRPRYTDILRYQDHYVTLSQGFGWGYRPQVSGGIGVLVEGEGNDLYLSDIFGQGSAYWYALGCLVDGGGNDAYVSYQYAQGSGVHLAAAALVDAGGDDRYTARGVSQGCGHDFAVGLLWDRAGEDVYDAFDLSQGAGSANGVGLLLDEAGEDGYWVKRAGNTHGYGNPRREYGSVGLLVDLAGPDHYAGKGADSSAWYGPWFGLGLDVESQAPPEAAQAEGTPASAPATETAAADSTEPPADLPAPPGGVYTPENLFVLAGTGEIRFQESTKWAFDELVRRGEESIPVLLDNLGTRSARERQTVRRVLTEIGEPAVDPLTEVLNETGASEKTWRRRLLAARTLGYIGSARAEEPLRRAAADSLWTVRETAVSALGRLHLPETASFLAETLRGDPNAQVRKSAVFALMQVDSARAIAPLSAALEDQSAIVRESAREYLVRIGKPALPALRDRVDRLTTGEARGSVGSLSEARAGALTLEAFADIVLPETAGGTAKPASSADGARDVAELVRAVVRFADAPSWVRVELRASCARVLARALPVATLSPRERSAAIGVARRLVADADRRVRAAAASITLDATPTASAGDARP